MSIRDYQSIMLPLLEFCRDGKEHSLRDAIEALAHKFGLTEQERKALLPSGQQPIFDNRVGWARTYLKKAGLIDAPRRSYFQITARGIQVLESNPPRIDIAFLERFPEFKEFRATRRKAESSSIERADVEETTPEESLGLAYQRLSQTVAVELIETVMKCSPAFFERLVIDLLVGMGYGGTRHDAGRAIGRSGDDGIDGIINEDRLGLDTIYVQAKRWQAAVGRPEVQKFAGALQGHRARKGIFITTSSFTKEAYEYASRIDSKIVLVDGDTLAQLMIEHNVGVSSAASYEVKRIDHDYFTEE